MRRLLALALLSAIAVPAAAQTGRPAVPPPPPAAQSGIPPEILDDRTLDQVGNMVGALTKAFLDLPVGEVEAAVENRPATREDRRKTVRSVTGTNERELSQDIEQSKGAMKAGGQAMVRALPVIRDALNRAGDEIERATANLPQPGYPRR
ncbi:hypothetical protein [Sphingomonas astaxanthinifaciens]|uniref:hypothetical protein n=1 Tax=Sphingomonas astaxanthinifaciens TaxID=407019 RepID=UPI000AFA34BA|nr:hypothetical protein [Sphingomonas astaxanthinifaciens]